LPDELQRLAIVAPAEGDAFHLDLLRAIYNNCIFLGAIFGEGIVEEQQFARRKAVHPVQVCSVSFSARSSGVGTSVIQKTLSLCTINVITSFHLTSWWKQ
jgi:hypothetical protein